MDDIFDGRRKRLRQFINTLIIKDKEFSESIGKKPTVLSQLLNGYRNISADFAYEVADRYTWLNPDWLISGKGEMRREPEVVESYLINESEPRTLEDLDKDYKADPLAGLRDLIERIEELEKWKAEIEGKNSDKI